MNQSNYYPSQDPLLKLRQEMVLRNFSEKTIKAYLQYITQVLVFANKCISPHHSGQIIILN